MSFQNRNWRWTYQPNGVTTAFAYDNLVLDAADLTVNWWDANGQALALPGYAVSGVGNPAGGAVTFNTPPAATAGSLLVIERHTLATQAAVFQDYMQEGAAARQARYDRSLALVQELLGRADRSILASPLEANGTLVLPPPAQRASKALIFGPDGTLMVGLPLAPGALAVSAFIQTLLDDVDGATALGTLGFSAYMRGLVGNANVGALLTALGLSAYAQATLIGLANQAALRTAVGLPLIRSGMLANLACQVTSNILVHVTADAGMLNDGTSNYAVGAIDVTIDASTVGANGLSADVAGGALANATWYYPWLIWNGVDFKGLLSTSATNPTLPAGYTYKTRVGAVRTNGAAQLYRTLQRGRDVQYLVGANPNAALAMTSGNTASAVTAVAVAAFVPPTASRIRGRVGGTDGGEARVSPNATFSAPIGAAGVSLWMPFDFSIEGANLYWKSATATAALYVDGWSEP